MIGVIGLAGVGLPLALAFTTVGTHVQVWDESTDLVTCVRDRACPTDEPYVADLLEHADQRLEAADLDEIVRRCEVIFLTVPPTLELLRRVVGASIVVLTDSRTVGASRAAQDAVPIGTVRFVYAPLLATSGSYVNDLQRATLQLIGDREERRQSLHARRVAELLRLINPAAGHRFMSYESAELARLAGSTLAALKLCMANQLAFMTATHGGDVTRVTQALAAFPTSYDGAGLEVGSCLGGPIVPRDVDEFANLGGSVGTIVHGLFSEHVNVVLSTAFVHWYLANGGQPTTFTVHGRAYKETTNDRTRSFGDELASRLAARGLTQVNSREADIVIIAQPLRELNLCNEVHPGAVVVDVHRTHPYFEDCPVTYVPFGVRVDQEAKIA